MHSQYQLSRGEALHDDPKTATLKTRVCLKIEILVIKCFGQVNFREIHLLQENFSQQIRTCCSLEKTPDFFHIFQDFTLIFHTFSRSGKCLSKFQDFFKNSRLCTNPAYQMKLEEVLPSVTVTIPRRFQFLSLWRCNPRVTILHESRLAGIS